jgi:hypothetical protein
LLAGLPPDLEGAPHGCPSPLPKSQSEGYTRRAPACAAAAATSPTEAGHDGPAELVTCDQTIERTINRLKGFRRVATRYEKRDVNYLAMVTIAAIVLLWLE